jgi:hypothetical protein
MGTQGIFPSKAVGGLGWHEQGGWSHLSLFGTTYCRMFPLSANNAFDNHLLPNHLLLDGATKDLGKDYAERLLRTRAYLRECHPLASSLCAIADVPGERVDLTPFMRIEAQSLRSSAMELAFVSGECSEEGSGAEEVAEEEEVASVAPVVPAAPAAQPRAPVPATRPARFQKKTALSLTQRRTETHKSVEHYYK